MTDYPDLTAARVLADSISEDGYRITTVEITMPRFILAEFNTHKSIARNSASSRAIPTARQIEMVEQTPFVPQQFPLNKPGMGATEYIEPGHPAYEELARVWLQARDDAVQRVRQTNSLAQALIDPRANPSLEIHKQIINRLLEPFMWHTVIATATWDQWDWPHVFELRISPFAQPEIHKAISAVRDACEQSTPIELGRGLWWHLPLIDDDDHRSIEQRIKSSVARCAAVSYNRHNQFDIDKEMGRYSLLADQKHLSPFEHVAHPHMGRNGPFTGWRNMRWYVENNRTPLPYW